MAVSSYFDFDTDNTADAFSIDDEDITDIFTQNDEELDFELTVKNPLESSETDKIKSRLKDLQRFHPEISQANREFNDDLAGIFTKSQYETDVLDNLKKQVSELMNIHKVTANMIPDASQNTEMDDLQISSETVINLNWVNDEIISNLKRKLDYLENTFRKEHECSLQDCDTNAVCSNPTGEYACHCKDGFSGNGSVCADTDECVLKKQDCSTDSVCTNTAGSFTCECKTGFEGDGKHCQDTDECVLKKHDCSTDSVCTNTAGSFTCECKTGFEGDGKHCKDTDECVLKKQDCSTDSVCTNTAGSFTCECKTGFEGDGINCTVKAAADGLYVAGASVTSMHDEGTKFTFECHPGFLNLGGTTSAQKYENGTWTLPTMLCAPTQCYYKVESKAIYAGEVNSVEVSGRSVACQRWDKQFPQNHETWNIYPYPFYAHSLGEVTNLCRDPDREGVPWCYTTSLLKKWKACDVPACDPGPQCSIAPFVAGADVTRITKDKDGRVQALYKCKPGLQVINRQTATCLGQNGNDEEWDVPPVICAPTDCFMMTDIYDGASTVTCAVYHGKVRQTKRGRTCQRWSSQRPHKHNYNTDDMFTTDRTVASAENFCRDPGGSRNKPWCYTTKIFIRWEYCDVPVCSFMLQ